MVPELDDPGEAGQDGQHGEGEDQEGLQQLGRVRQHRVKVHLEDSLDGSHLLPPHSPFTNARSSPHRGGATATYRDVDGSERGQRCMLGGERLPGRTG